MTIATPSVYPTKVVPRKRSAIARAGVCSLQVATPSSLLAHQFLADERRAEERIETRLTRQESHASSEGSYQLQFRPAQGLGDKAANDLPGSDPNCYNAGQVTCVHTIVRVRVEVTNHARPDQRESIVNPAAKGNDKHCCYPLYVLEQPHGHKWLR